MNIIEPPKPIASTATSAPGRAGATTPRSWRRPAGGDAHRAHPDPATAAVSRFSHGAAATRGDQGRHYAQRHTGRVVAAAAATR